MALTKTQVSELYVAIFNRASEGEGNQYWQGLDGSAAEIAALMLATPAAQAYFGDSLDSDQAFIEHIYLNTLGKTYADDAEGIDYWVGRLEAGEDRGALIAELVVAAQHPDFAGTPAQQQFLNRVEVSDYTADTLFDAPDDYATSLAFDGDLVVTENPGTIDGAKDAVDAIADDQSGEPSEPGEEGQRIRLTEGRDDVAGTAGDDTFVGYVGQNQNGTIVNEFSTGDFIDGGAGRDKIEATIQADLQADGGWWATVNPRTNNVEEVHLEALTDNGRGPSAETVVVDAGRMNSVEEFWSDNSSAHLELLDVRLGSKLSITKDVTFGLRDTDYETDFTALFDSQSLVNAPATASNSALSIRIADVSTETVDTPLANVNLNLSFTLGSETITLQNVQADGGTYLGLVTAIRTALAEAGHPELNVSVGETYEQVTFAGNTVTLPFTAQEVFITDPNGNDFANVNFTQSAIQPVQGGFLVAGNADPVDPSETTNLIESNLILDNAGRGSTAGDVHIGGMSNSHKGVQQFNVTVDRDSKIASLTTTNDALQNIVIDSMGANGSLVIGSTQGDLNEIDANGFAGANLGLGVDDAIWNLNFLDAGQTTADVTFEGVNVGGRPSAETNALLLTGSGDDDISLGLFGVSESGSTYTSAAIVTGAGNDVVTVFGSDDRNSAHIDTGTGNDTIHGWNISTIIEAGAGNDVIYAENTGDKAEAQLDAGSVYSTTTGAATANAVSVANLLNGRTVVVTVAMPEESAGVVDAQRGVDGFEVSATISASNGYLTTERDLYEAAARAINEHAYISKLVKASVDSNGHLLVEYLVDGATAAGAAGAAGDALVELKVTGAWNSVNAGLQNNILAQVRQEYQDSNITLADLGNAYNSVTGLVDHATTTVAGTDSWSSGSNTVNGGAGNDVIVLSSNDTGPGDTVVFDQGGFGYDYIVHFNDVSGGDVLDFSAWLDNVTSHSGSVASQVRIDGDVAIVGSITANQVAIANFTDLNTATGVTFAGVTDAQVLAALNNAGTAFGVGAADGDLVGDVQKSILMIQNDSNLGVYKVYEVTSGKEAADGFTAATLVGTVDFGDQLGALDDTNIA